MKNADNHLSPAHSLEQFLRFYEEKMWALSIYAQASASVGRHDLAWVPNRGPHLHYLELRKHMLEITSVADFDSGRFLYDNLNLHSSGKFLMNGDTCPSMMLPTVGTCMIAGWVSESRRIYKIDPDLQALLHATSINDVKISDIKLPFGMFGVGLERPLEAENNGIVESYDFILFGNLPYALVETGEQIWVSKLMLFSTKLAKWRPLTCTENVERKMSRKKVTDAFLLLKKKHPYGQYTDLAILSSVFDAGGTSVGDLIGSLETNNNYQGLLFSKAIHVVCGLCLYLSALPKDSTNVGSWKQSEKIKQRTANPDISAITDESQVCSVSSTKILSVEDRELLFDQINGRKTGYEVKAHWRVGHWRSLPLKYRKPDKPSIIWIQPTLVRRDRLAKGSVPQGIEVVVTK